MFYTIRGPDPESLLFKLNVVCLHQPQNSMPDVIIWMLRGEKRVAFARVPANQILYSNFSEQARGKHCGQTQTIFMQVRN